MQCSGRMQVKKQQILQVSYDTQQNYSLEEKIILYFNLTHSEESKTRLENLFHKGFKKINQIYQIFQFLEETEYIHFYYFYKIIEENSIDKIDLCQLTKLRIDLLNLTKQFGTCQIKVVLQYNDIQLEEYRNYIEYHIYQLFDGFLTEQQQIIILSSDEKQEQITCYLKQPILLDQETSLSILQEIKQNSLNKKDYQCFDIQLFQCRQFNQHFIDLLNADKGFFQFQYNDYCSIGFECYLYLRDQLEVLSQLILINIKIFQLNINELLELPINLKDEKNQDENIKQFLKLLYSLIIRFLQIINQKEICIYIIVDEISLAIKYWEPRILSQLKCLAQKSPIFNSYNQKENIFQFNQQQITDRYNSKLLIFQDFTNDTLNSLLKKDLEIISMQCNIEIRYFDFCLPSRFKLFQEIGQSSIQYTPINKPNICLLGLTKTGKSTLLNILINPKNIGIIEKGKQKIFSLTDRNNQIKISQSYKSETNQTVDIEIDNFIFTDTPGFQDTNSQNRLINQVKIFSQLQRSPQIIFLILIDGQKLCDNINDLYFTIEHINLFFGDKLIESKLENFIIPVFNKLESDTMKLIKDILEKEIDDNSNNKILYFLKAIKNRIDNNGHIELYNASYFFKEEIQNLNKQKQEIQNKITNLLRDNKISNEINDLNEQVIQLQNQIDIKLTQKKEINYNQLEDIKQQILNQSKYLQQIQSEQQSKIEFTLTLNADMKEHYNIILTQQDKICNDLILLITDVIINNLLNDHSRNVDDVINICSQIQNIIKEFKSTENISIFQFFNSFQQIIVNLFNNQCLLEDFIKKLNSVDNLSQFIHNGQKMMKISTKYLENELDLIQRSCNNLQNNRDFKKFLKNKRFEKIKILFFRLIQQVEKAERIQKSTHQQFERLKMVILKIEYEEIKKKQGANNNLD